METPHPFLLIESQKYFYFAQFLMRLTQKSLQKIGCN